MENMKNLNNLQENTRKWIDTFRELPLDMFKQLVNSDGKSWVEVTPIATGDNVYSLDKKEFGTVDEITTNELGGTVYTVDVDGYGTIETTEDKLEINYNRGYFPKGIVVWSFTTFEDKMWLEEDKQALQIMAECGFRIYKHELWGYFFGFSHILDGGDRMELSWYPLYEMRMERYNKSLEELNK